MERKTCVEIESLSQYFSAIEEYGLEDYVSRGEARRYPEILSAALRPYRSLHKYYGRRQLDEFYGLIGNELTPMQQAHFLAYAQHRGFPTPLIDFTYSPLISLFFACYQEGPSTEESGYVYFIPKRRLLQANQTSFTDQEEVWEDYVRLCESALWDYRALDAHWEREEYGKFEGELLACLQSIIRLVPIGYEGTAVARRFEKFLDRPPEGEAFYGHMQEARACMDFFLEKLRENKDFGDFNFYIGYFRDCVKRGRFDFLDRYRDRPPEADPEPDAYESFTDVLRFFVRVLMDIAYYGDGGSAFTLPYYYAYQPPNISGRINSQSSVFIYQMHIAREDRLSDAMLYQRLQPSFSIKVRRRAAVLRQLDGIGVNVKSVYGDHDSIAKYIRWKFMG